MTHFVVMGVSGCGKTSVGQGLSAELGADFGLVFIDGDDLHPAANIAKMSRGEPLNDADRAPWLRDVGQHLARHKSPVVISCSALKRSYRDIIRATAPQTAFLHLAAPKPVLAARVAQRKDHFMPPDLLDSQYAALEPLGPDESGTMISIDQPLEAVISEATTYVEKRLA